MHNTAFPTLRVEVEGVRHSIVTALASHGQEIELAASDAIARIDIPAIVSAEVQRQATPIIAEWVASAMRKGMYDEHGLPILTEAMRALLGEYLASAMTYELARLERDVARLKTV